MTRPDHWPIRRQVDLVLAALALPLVALLAYLVWQDTSRRLDAAQASLATLARAASANGTQFLARTENLLAGLAARRRIAAAGRDGCDPVFETFSAQNRDYANLLLVDAQGWVRCSAIRLTAGAPLRLGPMHVHERVRQERSLVFGRPEIGFLSGRWVVPITYPLSDASGDFAGHVGVSVDLERFRPPAVLLDRLDTAADLYIVDAEGFIIAAGEGAALKVGDRHDASLIARLATLESGRSQAREALRTGRLHALVPVAGTEWHVLADADAGPLVAAMWRNGLTQGAVVAVVLLFGLGLVRRVERASLDPIRDLAESARAIAAGKMQTRVVPSGAAEIAGLGEAFNRMLDAVAGERRHAGESEQELKTVLATVEAVVYALSGDGGTLLYLGPGAAKVYGRDVRPLASDPDWRHAYVTEDDHPRLAAMLQQLAEKGYAEAEYRIRHGDGSLRWLHERCYLLRDADGVPLRRMGVITDVSDSHALVEALVGSEARFRALTLLSSDWYWEQDEAFRFTAVEGTPGGKAGAYLKTGMLGKCRWEAPSIGLDAAHWTAHRVQLERHEPFRNLEYGIDVGNGKVIFVSISGEPVFDGSGRFTGYRGIGRDITDRMTSEMQLRKLSAAVEQSPVSILITDIRGDIEYVNPRFCQSTGYTLDEMRGRNPRILKSGETPAEVYKQLWEAITRGEEWSGELHNRKKNGELFWEFVRIIPLVSDVGEVMNFLAVKEDITLRKELTAREQLRQEQMLHHARLAAMGEMAAALAHELNQPLAAIANFSGVVEHALAVPEPDLESARTVVRTIAGQALRAGDIVWRVREFSRKQPARREPVDLNALVGDVVRLADIAARSREVAYEFDLAPGLPPASIDRVQIEQVLLNLIRNGVEAMEDGNGEKRLLIASRMAEGGGAVQLSVSDCGCGLPDRIAVDLFTPFFTTKPEGMGMGLSISRGIVEAHGGRLWAAPNEGAGTTFHLTLPLAGEEKQ
ncbi:MAG: hypothetical protein CVU18_10510 [Betaproteobacteria bacterium HGW-Betaproteobacteria-12]|nr:MAG: hypothetical protein CVU18_10510 [Betaproteobacteria bacterium HGW-Betaproteobacteria-12]